ncbi:hypothetical protein Fmac_016753 [Flemingia macrophylla]|uniref:Uncharacterized protein n=1 Tax=Flemingia macrophylla TaxID=520843 RepID=A0ABD1MKH5_9FABA
MAGMAAPPLTLPIGMAAPPLTLPTNHDNIDRAAGSPIIGLHLDYGVSGSVFLWDLDARKKPRSTKGSGLWDFRRVAA